MKDYVTKRDGRRAKYNSEKIKQAIFKSMIENSINQADGKAEDVTIAVDNRLYNKYFNNNEIPHVEDIQDIIEKILMESGYYDTAKSYIIYRNKRDQSRYMRQDKGLLSKDFLSKYKKQPNPFPTELGEFIYYRTYSRWLPEEKRREYWWETVKRAVEYIVSLAPTSKEEAEKLFDDVYNFRVFLSGRTLFTGGTKASRKYPMSNFNCAGIAIEKFDDFLDLFYCLMVGAGVGFSVLPKNVNKIPKIKNGVEIIHKQYKPVAKENRLEHTEFNFDNNDTTVTINVGDSKGGWIQALGYYFKFLTEHEYRPVKRIIINYDSVRPKGERLETFGGTASGFESLRRMFDKINMTLKKKDSNDRYNRVKLDPIDVMDIANVIAENVVVGGVRRSSQICLFNKNNDEIRECKSNLYTQENGEWKIDESIAHRQMSNNSIMYFKKPTKKELSTHINEMKTSGEPGFINAEEARRRRDNFKLVNPCGEALLDSKGMCNLTSVNVKAFVKDDNTLDMNSLIDSHRRATRAAYRMAQIEFELPEWDQVNKRDRLIGVSLTGWHDMANSLGWNNEKFVESAKVNRKNWPEGQRKQYKTLEALKSNAQGAAEEYAAELGENIPVLTTIVKPEGTQTQMPTVSSGLHFNHSPYYLRRVRISANDPLVKACEEQGFKTYPEVGQDPDDPQTKVIEFPIKAPKGKVKGDVSAIEQLEVYKMFMDAYTDHNSSITVHVREDEWADVEEWLWENWNSVVGVSFIPYNDSFYKLMPYEKISEEEYKEYKKDFPSFNPSLVNKYEARMNVEKEREIEEDECATGACPIR